METETKTDIDLVAEFMGNKPIHYQDTKKVFGYHVVFGFQSGPTLISDIKYDTSWDWLMPVVEKIFKTYNPSGSWPYEYVVLTKFRLGASIQEVYQAVLAFIKWYNNQKATS